jgi:serine/threonine protein kinase
LEYCAPELVKPVQGRLAPFCKKTDIFSLGMILYYLCFAKLPYSKSVWDEERQDIDCLTQEVQSFNGFDYESVRNLRQDLTPEIYSLLSRMLSVNPAERPSAGEVLLCLSGSSTASSLSQKSPEQVKSSRSIATIGVREKAVKAVGSLISGIIVVKCVFLLIKAMTLMKLESGSLVFQMLLFLAGIEVPLMSLRLTTALFAIHCYSLFLVSLRDRFF